MSFLILPIDAVRHLEAQANNAAELEANLALELAAYLAANPSARVLDLQICGSGAGNVFGALMSVIPSGTSGIPASTAILRIVDAATPQQAKAEIDRVLAGNVGDEILGYDTAMAGNGAVYLIGIVLEDVG